MSQSDKRKMRWLSAVFLVGVVLIWTGLLHHYENAQLFGEAVCIVGFAWLALGGWRIMRRGYHQLRAGTD